MTEGGRMNLYIELKETFDKLYIKYKKNTHIWLEIETTFSMLRSYFYGYYMSPSDVSDYIGRLLNYAKKEKLMAYTQDSELDYILKHLEELANVDRCRGFWLPFATKR